MSTYSEQREIAYTVAQDIRGKVFEARKATTEVVLYRDELAALLYSAILEYMQKSGGVL